MIGHLNFQMLSRFNSEDSSVRVYFSSISNKCMGFLRVILFFYFFIFFLCNSVEPDMLSWANTKQVSACFSLFVLFCFFFNLHISDHLNFQLELMVKSLFMTKCGVFSIKCTTFVNSADMIGVLLRANTN